MARVCSSLVVVEIFTPNREVIAETLSDPQILTYDSINLIIIFEYEYLF